jgi:hypothetical protein
VYNGDSQQPLANGDWQLTTSQLDWNCWKDLCDAEAVSKGYRLETQVSFQALLPLNGENPNILIRVADAEGNEDYSDNIICPKVKGALTIKVTNLAEDIIEIGSENNSMLKLELIANGGKVKVNSLQLNIEGSATDTDVLAVELYESAGGTNSPRPPSFTSRSRKIAEGDFSEGEREDKQIRFIFDPAIVIKQEEPKTYFVTIDISDSAKMSRTVGLSLGSDDVQTNCPRNDHLEIGNRDPGIEIIIHWLCTG